MTASKELTSKQPVRKEPGSNRLIKLKDKYGRWNKYEGEREYCHQQTSPLNIICLENIGKKTSGELNGYWLLNLNCKQNSSPS